MADIEPKIPIEADNDSRQSKQSFMRWYILSTMNQYSIRRHVHESSGLKIPTPALLAQYQMDEV